MRIPGLKYNLSLKIHKLLRKLDSYINILTLVALHSLAFTKGFQLQIGTGWNSTGQYRTNESHLGRNLKFLA